MKRFVLSILTGCVTVLSVSAQLPMRRGANDPVGTPQGIHPGRVAWTHAPGATTWEGDGAWYDDAYNSQPAADWMVRQALKSLTDKSCEKSAWQALFRDFNARKHGEASDYQAGQKIGIKVNMNNTYDYRESGEINASPHLVLALLRSLIHKGGVPQECITVFDASRMLTDGIYGKCHHEFPQVHYVDHVGEQGRTQTGYVAERIRYSQPSGAMCTGLSTVCTESDYLINMALLKGHVGQGVTLCGKNWFGTTSIQKDWRKNAHVNMNQDDKGQPRYITFVDYMGHQDMGGKTLLYLVDALYACKYVSGAPGPKWQMAPFSGNWPCSLFASQDPVAIDAVALDFLVAEFPDAPDMKYCDAYLEEAALADQAPSGTVYDPEGDGTPLPSLGVLEHWDNPVNKHYTQIELIYKKK